MATTSLSFSSSSDVTSKSINYGNSIKLYIRNRVSSNKYKISVSCNSKSEWVIGSDSSYSTSSSTTYSNYNNWQRKELFRDSSNNRHTSVVMVFTLYVYNSAGVQQNTSSVTATITLSSSTPISIDSTYSAYNTVSGVSGYIQSVSKIQHDTYVYSTTNLTQYTVSAELTLGGVKSTVTASSVVALSAPNDSNLYKVTLYSPVITTYGSVTSSYRLKFTKSSTYQDDMNWSVTVSVSAYSAPQITAYGASRYRLDNGQLVKDDSGDYIKFYFTGAVTSVGNNTGQFVIRYRKTNTSPWTNTITVRSGFTDTFSISQSSPVVLSTTYNPSAGVPTGTYVVLSAESTWDVNFYLTDTISDKGDSRTLKLSVGFATLEFLAGGKGIAVGKAAEVADTLDVAFKGKFHQNITVLGSDTQGNNIRSTINGGLDISPALGIASGGTGAVASDFSTSTGKVVKYKTSPTQQLYSADLTASDIPSLDASKITSGTFATARIPDLSASKITSGTLGTDRIPSLSASKITSGEFAAARIPNLAASKITSGTFSSDRIPDLAASKITSGRLSSDRLPTNVFTSSSVVPITCGGTGGNTHRAARFNLQIYCGTTNVSVTGGGWQRSLWIVPNNNSFYTDDMSIIVCPAQNIQSYDLSYYVQRYSDYKGFYIWAKDNSGKTATITFAWLAIPYYADDYSET